MPKEQLLAKLKKSVLGDDTDDFADIAESDEDDGLDIEAGVIHIDDSDGDMLLSTTDVLRESHTSVEESLVRGHGGKVYVLDLRPFFKAIHGTPETKLGQNLIGFSENVLARMIGHRGTYTLHRKETFFFRLNLGDVDGWAEAAKIVNDIGRHFLRDSYKVEEFENTVLGAVDAKDALDENGNFSFELALQAKDDMAFAPTETKPEKEINWVPIGEPTEEVDWASKWEVQHHASSERVQRGPDRRQGQAAIAFADRRRRRFGRRDADDPHKSVW